MQTVIIKPKNAEELQLVTQLMKRMKIKADIVANETQKQRKKREFLEGLERSVEEVNTYLKGEKQLKSARELLDEL